MNENEVALIRQYLHIHYLIKEAVSTIEWLPTSRIALSDMLKIGVKLFGGKLRDRLKDTERELRTFGVHVWIEDDGDEVIYVCTNKRGTKGRHGVKRRILREDMEVTLAELMETELDHSLYVSQYKVMTTAGFEVPRV
jgi:hypothetical protein